jgi:hypothetical protein
MKSIYTLAIVGILLSSIAAFGQDMPADTVKLKRGWPNKEKVLHAEPLYIDLIRDLGARKGEKEWNVGMGLTDNYEFDSYEALVEYEWAPANNLGLEVELPFTFYSSTKGIPRDSIPANQINSLKLAAQWTFFTNQKHATSMALGYIHEFELADFRTFQQQTYRGNIYNPFLIVAKRWGQNFHTLLYTGPQMVQHFDYSGLQTNYEANFSTHYMIPNSRNFIGVEFNQLWTPYESHLVIRPQMRVAITEHTMIGIVGGISTNREIEGLSSFVRLIWEPPAK